MLLSEYLEGDAPNGRSNFATFDARLPNGGKITAHHGRDKSTEQYYEKMADGQFLISYNMPDGTSRRCEIAHGGITVVVVPSSKYTKVR